MHARTARSPLYAAGVAAVAAAALAGCASAGSGTAAAKPTAAASATPLAAVKLAAKTTSGASSFTGTISVQATAKNGASSDNNVTVKATMAERVRPSIEAEVQIGTLSAGGSSMPGEMTEVITPSDFYMKWAVLTQELHQSKPWLVLPVSALSKSSGINFSELFSSATNSSPLNESQMLAGASSVRKVGTGTINGVPVTEYTGTLSLAKSMQYLTGSAKSAMEKEIAAGGLSTASFSVWIDGQQVMRKMTVTESGTEVTEVTTVTVASINQPVNIAIPAASQTSPMPAAALSGLGS